MIYVAFNRQDACVKGGGGRYTVKSVLLHRRNFICITTVSERCESTGGLTDSNQHAIDGITAAVRFSTHHFFCTFFCFMVGLFARFCLQTNAKRPPAAPRGEMRCRSPPLAEAARTAPSSVLTKAGNDACKLHSKGKKKARRNKRQRGGGVQESKHGAHALLISFCLAQDHEHRQ